MASASKQKSLKFFFLSFIKTLLEITVITNVKFQIGKAYISRKHEDTFMVSVNKKKKK